jgi:hypothetical protein
MLVGVAVGALGPFHVVTERASPNLPTQRAQPTFLLKFAIIILVPSKESEGPSPEHG